jgi:hypothetical protein
MSEQEMMDIDPDGIQLTEEELQIVDFINNYLTECDSQARIILSEIVTSKFGDVGDKVFNLMFNEDEMPDLEECSECGEISDEWIEKTKAKMALFEDLLDDEYDELVEKIIEENKDSKNFSIADIKKTVKAETEDSDETTIMAIVWTIVKKILWHGITNGWLTDLIFKDKEKEEVKTDV